MICISMVDPAQIVVPVSNIVVSSKNFRFGGPAGKFSGEVDGFVTSHPSLGCGTRKSSKNSALPFSTG